MVQDSSGQALWRQPVVVASTTSIAATMRAALVSPARDVMTGPRALP